MNENEQDHVSDQTENNSENPSGDSQESYTLIIRKDGEDFEVGSFGSSAEIIANEEQFNKLLDEIKNSKTEDKKVDSIIDRLDRISGSLADQRKAEEQSRSEGTATETEYFEYYSDVLGQIDFFTSLIFGLLVSFLFCYGLKR